MKDIILTEDYYRNKSTIELSKDLLGKILVHESKVGVVSGRIVETEAYLSDDPAAHSYIGKTERNKSVFDEAGTSYVYFIYGNYNCFNVAAREKDIGEAVLVRALEPIEGIDLMKKNIAKFNKNRKHIKYSELPLEKICNGPGKLCLALDIDRSLDGHKLWNRPLFLLDDGFNVSEKNIVTTTRIGIKKAAEELLRFYIKDSKFVSRK